MVLSVLFIQVNHIAVAQDLCMLEMGEQVISLSIFVVQYSVPDNSDCVAERLSLVFIVRNSQELFGVWD